MDFDIEMEDAVEAYPPIEETTGQDILPVEDTQVCEFSIVCFPLRRSLPESSRSPEKSTTPPTTRRTNKIWC